MKPIVTHIHTKSALQAEFVELANQVKAFPPEHLLLSLTEKFLLRILALWFPVAFRKAFCLNKGTAHWYLGEHVLPTEMEMI